MLRPVAPARQQAARALAGARRREAGPEHAMLALQRKAGNAAVNALIAGRMRTSSDEAIGRLDAALREIRKDEPAIDTVEKGLRDAKAVGVPVDLEGVKPPPAALAVTTTGFGPGSVAPKKPVPPAKPVPKTNPLAKAASRRTPPRKAAAPARRPPVSGPAGGVAAPPRALSPDQRLQPPVPPAGVRPDQDPAFAAVRSGLVKTGSQARAHPPATAKAKEAQDAAVPPTGDLGAQARAAKIDTMDAQQPGSFDKKAFITAVKAAIEAKSPKTLKEADDYKKSGKAAEVKGDVKGLVTQGTEGQAKDVETATQAPPDESKAVPKPVTPLPPEPVGQVPAVPATGAAPKPAPPEQTNLQAGKAEADRELADAGVTETQLEQSGETEFQQAVTDKKTAAKHADAAPGQYRQQEQQQIQQTKAEATASAATTVTGMNATKAKTIAGLVADKGKAKSRDEAKRAEVTTKIQGIYAAAEKDVKAILDGIDPKVEAEFNRGEASARAEFENYVDAKMSAYKKDRYGGWLGGFRWAKDKLLGMPEKVNEFYAAGRELYLKRMDGVIERVANIVGGDLDRAKKRIAAGRTEIAAYVKSLPADLQKVGGQAAQDIGEKFEALEGEVAAKQEAAVDLLASKYVEARKGLDERIEALQAENKGLVDKAIGAIKAVINTIRQLAAMLRDVLARAAGVVGDIIASPVRFLGNLIAGVKGGILKFKDNILDHLRKGLMSWLFGALAEGGIELPKSFDLKGIIGFLASLFGLTWARIRARIAKKIGEPAMSAIEKGVEIFQKFRAEGVAGLWQMLVDKLGDIKEMILDQVKDFVVTKIITAGITWLIGLLNPAAAFIKACKLIYDVVMFFVNNAARIKRFVDTVLDSVADVVRGNVGGVVEKINNVLGQMVPILIGFLASVIGLGGIGQKIREIVEKLQKPVTKAIDFVIDKGLKLAGPVLRGLKKVSGYVKGKVAAGKAWVKGKAETIKTRLRGGDDSPRGKQARLDKGMAAALGAVNRFAGRTVGEKLLKPFLAGVRLKHGLTSLTLTDDGQNWSLVGVVNPTKKSTSRVKSATNAGVDALVKAQQSARRRIKHDLRTAWNSNSVRKRLATDPVLKNTLQREFNRLTNAMAGRTQAVYEDLVAGRPSNASIPKLVEVYRLHRDAADVLIQRLEDMTKPAAELAEEADKARVELQSVHKQAVAITAEPAVGAVLALHSFKDLSSRLRTRQKHVEDAIKIITTRTLDQLRQDVATARKFLADANSAKSLTHVAEAIKPMIASIKAICENTGPRAGAIIPPGTTEAAAIHEANTGKRVKERAHGPKCAMEARGLRKEIAKLTDLQGQTTDSGVLQQIKNAISEATTRANALDTGAKAWNDRVANDPQHLIWNPDGSSKIDAGFGKGI